MGRENKLLEKYQREMAQYERNRNEAGIKQIGGLIVVGIGIITFFAALSGIREDNMRSENSDLNDFYKKVSGEAIDGGVYRGS